LESSGARQIHLSHGEIHPTLRYAPAMKAGVVDSVWGLEEVIELLD
jgi:hypothetical protein